MEREAREERVVGGSRRDAPVVQHVVGHVVVDPPRPLVILRFLSAEEDQLVVHAGAPARVLEEPRAVLRPMLRDACGTYAGWVGYHADAPALRRAKRLWRRYLYL